MYSTSHIPPPRSEALWVPQLLLVLFHWRSKWTLGSVQLSHQSNRHLCGPHVIAIENAGGALAVEVGPSAQGTKEGLGLELRKGCDLASQVLLSRLDVSRQSGQRDRKKQGGG